MEDEEPGSERNVAPKRTAYRGMMLAQAGRLVNDGVHLDGDGRLLREALYQRGASFHPNEKLNYNGHDSDDDDDDDEEEEKEEAEGNDHQTPMVATRGPTRNNSNNGGSSAAAAAARDVLRGMRTRSGSLLRDAPRPRAVPPELVQGTIDDKYEPEQEDGVDIDGALSSGAPPDGDTGRRRRLFTSPSLRGRDSEEDPAAASKYISESTRKRIIAKRMRYRGFESLDYSIYRTGWGPDGAGLRSDLHWNIDKQRYDVHIPSSKTMVGWAILMIIAIAVACVFFVMALAAENLSGVRWGVIFYIASNTLSNDDEDDGQRVASFATPGSHSFLVGLLALFPVFVALNMSLSTLSALLVTYLCPASSGSGLAEMRAYLNGLKMDSALSWRAFVAKIFGNVLALSSGLVVGKEGPLLHIGSIVASFFGKKVSRSGGQRGADDDLGRRRLEEEEEDDDEEECEMATDNCGPLSKLLRPFRTNVERRDLVTAGAAVGIAVGFNAPIGGILFAFEQVATWWRHELTWKTFFSCAIGVIAIRMLNGICIGQKRCGYYQPSREFALWSVDLSSSSGMLPDTGGFLHVIVDRVPILVIGVAGGVFGAAYVWVSTKLLMIRARILRLGSWRHIADVVGLSLVTSALLFWMPLFFGECHANPAGDATGWSSPYKLFIRYNCPSGQYNDLALLVTGSQTNSIKLLFSTPSDSARNVSPQSLVLFLGQMFLLSAFTSGASIPSGMFTPCILIGAVLGRVCGVLLQGIGFGNADLAVCALLGSASFVSGVLRRTVSLGVVLIEVTSAVSIVPSLMISMLIAKCIGDRVNSSLVDEQTRIKEIPYLAPRPAAVTRGLSMRAADVMSTQVVVVNAIERVGRILDILKCCEHSAFPVVDGRTCEGIVTRKSLVTALKLPVNFMRELPVRDGRTQARAKFGPSGPMRKIAVARSLKSDSINVHESHVDCYIDLCEYVLPNPCVEQDTPLEMTHDMFRTMGLSHIPVVRECADVVGMVSRLDLLSVDAPAIRRLEEIIDEEGEPSSDSPRLSNNPGERGVAGIPRRRSINEFFENVDDIEEPLLFLRRQQ